MDKDSAIEPNKLFVGGLNWNTTHESLKDYFTQFGEVTDCVVMYDNSNKPRGFGFVTFKEQASIDKALAKGEHILDKKKIDPKPAKMKGKNSIGPKLFMGGLNPETTEERVLKFFNEELDIPVKAISAEVKRDGQQKSRGFGFLQVDSEESLCSLLSLEKKFTIDGKEVELKKAHAQYKQIGENQLQRHLPGSTAQMMYSNNGYYPAASMYNRGNQQYTQSSPSGNYIPSPYGYPSPHQSPSNYQSFEGYQPSSSYYSGSGQYSSRGYSGGGQQQMGNYPAESTYTQTSSTFTGNDSYSTSSVMSFPYGHSSGGYHQYGNDQNGGGSPSSYSRVGFPSQGRGGGSSAHNNSYPAYGSR